MNSENNELETLNRIWNEKLDRVELAIDLNQKILTENRVSKISKSLNRFVLFAILDIASALTIILFAWSFVLGNWPVGYLIFPVLSLLALGHWFLGTSIYDLVLVSRIDFGSPVLDNQTSLEKLKANRVRTFKWIILLSPWMGFSLLMVAVAWLTDFQVFQKLSVSWIVANFIFGIIFVPIGILTAKWLVHRPQNAAWIQKVYDAISGKNLAEATRFLEELKTIRSE